VRRHAVRMVAAHGLGYLGQALSSAELMSALLVDQIRAGVDRLVVSPGHYVIAVYGAAVEAGRLSESELATYGMDGSALETIGGERTPVVDCTCGSLGQGLSVAAGLCLAARLRGEDRDVFAFVSDGEMEEGQVWEAAMFAGHHRLDRLMVVIDANDSQVDAPVSAVTTIEPIAGKWRAFGWGAREVDGHDVRAVLEALDGARQERGRPQAIVARTQVTHGLRCFPPGSDGHFLKVPREMAAAALAELSWLDAD
jgi:transketolase